MTSLTGGAWPLKLDRLGRVRIPRAKREEILAEFEWSGVSGAEFARLTGIKYPTLANWIQQGARHRATPPVHFVEAEVARPLPAMVPLELELPGGARLRVEDVGQIPLAVQLLRSLGPC